MKVIIYHDDNDGRCAAAITLKALQELEDPLSMTFVPATYDKAEQIANGVSMGQEVYIVDFSFSPELFKKIEATVDGKVVWIDHHKSAIEKLAGTELEKLPGIRSVEKAACALAWEYWNPNEQMPIAVKLIADRDAWIWEFEDQTAEFHYGLSLHETNPQAGIWEMLLREGKVAAQKLKSDGRLVLQALGQRFKDLRDMVAFDTEIDGHSVRAMNIAMAGSAAFGAPGWAIGELPEDVEICCQYYHNGKVFTISLYSKKGTVDVSELCKTRGGGGHAHAAGFTSSILPAFLRGGE